MKTSELTGAALDWAVAICEPTQCNPDHYSPSTDWAQGGPIIERERTEFDFKEDTQMFHAYDGLQSGTGPTHLIAAMRCYVASQLGDEVEIPKELT
jgi:hypothetical protein